MTGIFVVAETLLEGCSPSFFFFFSFSKAACLCFHSPLSLSFFAFFFLSFEVDTQCCNSPSFLSSENQKNHTFFFLHLVSNSYKLSRRADGMMFQRNLPFELSQKQEKLTESNKVHHLLLSNHYLYLLHLKYIMSIGYVCFLFLVYLTHLRPSNLLSFFNKPHTKIAESI